MCRLDTATGSTAEVLSKLIATSEPAHVAMEVGSMAGWAANLVLERGVEDVRVPNGMDADLHERQLDAERIDLDLAGRRQQRFDLKHRPSRNWPEV